MLYFLSLLRRKQQTFMHIFSRKISGAEDTSLSECLALKGLMEGKYGKPRIAY